MGRGFEGLRCGDGGAAQRRKSEEIEGGDKSRRRLMELRRSNGVVSPETTSS